MQASSTLLPAVAATALAVGYLLGRHRKRTAGLGDFSKRRFGAWSVRAATSADIAAVHALVRELAAFEKQPDAVLLSVEEMQAHLEAGAFECLVLEPASKAFLQPNTPPSGYAIAFPTYSTWEGPCMYLEDLYVAPAARGQGGGQALLRAVAALAAKHGSARLQWQALDWNTKAVEFYQSENVGARERVEPDGAKWLNFILTRDQALACARATSCGPPLSLQHSASPPAGAQAWRGLIARPVSTKRDPWHVRVGRPGPDVAGFPRRGL